MSYSWFRVEASIATNPKVLAFEEAIGDPNGLAYVTRLHCWTHIHATSGTFSRTLERQVEAACKWKGEPGKLIAAFVVAGLVDVTRRTAEVHDWEEYQGAIVEKSKRDAKFKKAKREAAARAAEETARAARAPGAQPAPAPTLPTRRDLRDGRSLDEPVLTPAISDLQTAPTRGTKSWALVAEQLADWCRKQRAVAVNFGPDREADLAAIHAWAVAWVRKHEPTDAQLDVMREAFNAYLADPWAAQRDCALSLWATETVWEPRWNNERAKHSPVTPPRVSTAVQPAAPGAPQ